MLIGVPREIKNHEYRVGLTPGSVGEIVHHGHQVLVETEAGAGIGMHDLTDRRLVNDHCEPIDDTALLEQTHASQARGLGQMDALSQLYVGDTSISLQFMQDSAICSV